MVNARQRAPLFSGVVEICVAAAFFLLLLQQPVTLPQKTGLSCAARGGDRFAGTPAQGIVMVTGAESALRAVAFGSNQPSFTSPRNVSLMPEKNEMQALREKIYQVKQVVKGIKDEMFSVLNEG